MHLFERAYSISNSVLLRNCCKRLKDSADWFSASFVITGLFFPSCFCFLGDRMGTGRGDQGVLPEQRQNRGNLHHAPNYNTSCQHCLAYREAILISSGCRGEVLVGLMGGLCAEQLFQTLQSSVVFLAVKREGKREGKENVHKRVLGETLKRTSSQTYLITIGSISIPASMIFVRTNCTTVLFWVFFSSHSVYTVKTDTKYTTGYHFSSKPASPQLPQSLAAKTNKSILSLC